MEISGAVLRRGPIVYGAGVRHDAGEVSSGRRARICVRFADEGHVGYYRAPGVRCGAKKEEKKRARLVRELSKDLEAFYSMGFGVEAGEGATGEVKGKMMTEAADLLMSQLKQLKAEEKELKKKRKQEKAAMKAARMKDCDTSSSSSESSDSECEALVRMRTRMSTVVSEPKLEIPAIPMPAEAAANCCMSSAVLATEPTEKIEVCMGGKCKKSGAMELLEEFERRVGVEGAVVGCKCMGKCRDGPNVRVLNQSKEEGEVKRSINPLCIGVGLDDVGAIVANYFGENRNAAGLLAA